MSLGISVNRRKIGALLAYLCFLKPDIQLRKLLKLVYLIDEESVRQRAIPVTRLDYYAWAKGPVAPDVYAVKDGALSDFVNCTKDTDGKWHVSPVKKVAYLIDKDMVAFSDWEMTLIKSVLDRYGHKYADALTEDTHLENTLWSQVVKEKGIDFSENPKTDCLIDLNRINEGNPDALSRYEDAQDAIYMQSLIFLKQGKR